MGSYRTIQDHMGSYWAIWGYTVPNGTIHTKWDQISPYGSIQDHTRTFGTMRDHIWDQTGQNWVIRGHMWPYEAVWGHTGPFGVIPAILDHMDHMGPNSPYWTEQGQMGP